MRGMYKARLLFEQDRHPTLVLLHTASNQQSPQTHTMLNIFHSIAFLGLLFPATTLAAPVDGAASSVVGPVPACTPMSSIVRPVASSASRAASAYSRATYSPSPTRQPTPHTSYTSVAPASSSAFAYPGGSIDGYPYPNVTFTSTWPEAFHRGESTDFTWTGGSGRYDVYWLEIWEDESGSHSKASLV